jgi:hypothetical protein
MKMYRATKNLATRTALTLAVNLLGFNSPSFASGGASSSTVLHDYGMQRTVRVIEVSEASLRVVNNGSPCGTAYLSFANGYADGRLETVHSSEFQQGDLCKVFSELLDDAKVNGGKIAFAETLHLQKIQTYDDGDVSIYLSCRVSSVTKLASGTTVVFLGQPTEEKCAALKVN